MAEVPHVALPGRALGIDLGSKRIGIAVSDSAGTMAHPRQTLVRSGDRARDHRALVALAVEEEVTTVVFGLPLSLDGTPRAAAHLIADEVDELRPLLAASDITVVLIDERLTTVSAHQALAASGQRARQRRETVDQAAAAVLLDAWLDGQRTKRSMGQGR